MFLVVISIHPHTADVQFQRFLVLRVQLKIKFNSHRVYTIAIMFIKNKQKLYIYTLSNTKSV